MKVTRKITFKTDEICVGDQITVKLYGLGKFTATAMKVTEAGALFLFDEAIAKRPINSQDTNNGGFEASELNRWLHYTVLPAFPKKLRCKVADITLPTYGEILGHDFEPDFYKKFEPDDDEQFKLMKQSRNRVCTFGSYTYWYWLRNATKPDVSSAYFADVIYVGAAGYDGASYSGGVRPEFWLVR